MKKIVCFTLTLITGSYLIAQSIIELPFYKETDHFKVYCAHEDKTVTDIIINKQETLFEQLSSDFKHQFRKTKIFLNIYPDLKSFHCAINWQDAPDWVVGHHGKNEISIVSPRKPNSFHSYNSIINSAKTGLVTAFIYEKYKNHESIPRWIHQGVALYKSNFFSKKNITKLTKDLSLLPTLEQLESIEKNDTLSFDKLHGFIVSFSLIQFIDEKWGWNAILDLLEDYSRFEKIFNISKAEFRNCWIEYLCNHRF